MFHFVKIRLTLQRNNTTSSNMERIRSAKKRILDFAPSFYSGMASVLMPGEKSKRLRKAVMSMGQDEGLYEDWRAVGNDLRRAMSKYDTKMKWQRK